MNVFVQFRFDNVNRQAINESSKVMTSELETGKQIIDGRVSIG